MKGECLGMAINRINLCVKNWTGHRYNLINTCYFRLYETKLQVSAYILKL